MRTRQLLIPLVPLALGACSSAPDRPALSAINETLDAFHHAAAHADEEAYFDLIATDGVFLGTDATERWPKQEFRRWAEPFFERDSAWTYKPIERHIGVNRARDTAWFDEVVRNENYGDLRGSGALILTPAGWKITQYNLMFPIPNDIAQKVVQMVRESLQEE